jgi:uncharacterized membrane protein
LVLLLAGIIALFAGISAYYDWQKAVKEWTPEKSMPYVSDPRNYVGGPPEPPSYPDYITWQIEAGIILNMIGGLVFVYGLKKMIWETKPRIDYPIFSMGVLLR